MPRELEPGATLFNYAEQEVICRLIYESYARDEALHGPSYRVLRLNLQGEDGDGVLLLMVILPDDDDCQAAQDELDAQARAALWRLAPGHIPSITRLERWLR